MRVLGIESSCDDTGIAVYDGERGLIAHLVYSQSKVHAPFGGVVPELASRDHMAHIVQLVDRCLHDAGLHKQDIDGIAYTAGPGLVGALLVGACFAKSLAFGLQKPALAIHHLEGHILAAQLENPDLRFPFLVLLVSGGHTQLMLAHALGEYSVVGETLDDAVGEAFDKVAKLMGLAYPGGPLLAKWADECPIEYQNLYPPFPRPMVHKKGYDFSFSGLKTYALHVWESSLKDIKTKMAIAYAFQEAIVETLVVKCQRAFEETASSTLVIAGGVGANRTLRKRLQETFGQDHLYFPNIALCTDNGAMIAYAGYLRMQKKEYDTDNSIVVHPRWPI